MGKLSASRLLPPGRYNLRHVSSNKWLAITNTYGDIGLSFSCPSKGNWFVQYCQENPVEMVLSCKFDKVYYLAFSQDDALFLDTQPSLSFVAHAKKSSLSYYRLECPVKGKFVVLKGKDIALSKWRKSVWEFVYCGPEPSAVTELMLVKSESSLSESKLPSVMMEEHLPKEAATGIDIHRGLMFVLASLPFALYHYMPTEYHWIFPLISGFGSLGPPSSYPQISQWFFGMWMILMAFDHFGIGLIGMICGFLALMLSGLTFCLVLFSPLGVIFLGICVILIAICMTPNRAVNVK